MAGTHKSSAEDADRDERYRAPALDKGLDILELLSQQPGGLTRGEIVKAMGRGPSEVYRMLERLVARDYVSRSREGDRYALTMKLFALAHRHPPVRRLVDRALPLMDAFAREAVQSCHLVIPERDAAIVVAHSSPPGNWEFGIRIGAQIDLLATGSGRTLLAFQSEGERAEMLARWAGNDLVKTYDGMWAELAQVRSAGHRIGQSAQIKGIDDISVPILSPDGNALAVLTCPYIQRLDDSQAGAAQTLDLLKAIGTTLSFL